MVSRIGKFIETKNGLQVTRVGGQGGSGELLLSRYRIFLGDEEVLGIDSDDGYTTL